MRNWKNVRTKAKELRKGQVNLAKLASSGDLSLEMLMQIMETPSLHENKAQRKERYVEFYKQNEFWGATKDAQDFLNLIDNLPENHNLVIPFPAIAVSFDLMVQRIFKERTKLLVKTVANALKNYEYSTLNWWYFVKNLYPEINNQVLIQYKPSSSFSFEEGGEESATIINIWDLYRFTSRTGISLESFNYFEMQESEADNPESQTVSQILERADFFIHLRKMKEVFAPFGDTKRLRILSTLKYPFDNVAEDMFRMYFNLNYSEWEADFKSSDRRIRKNLEDCVDIARLHDVVSYRVRTKTLPFEPLDQEPVKFLEKESLGVYKIRVPRSNHDLDYISQRLQNCVGKAGYAEKIKAGVVFIVEVLKEDQSFACLEYSVKHKRFIQAKELRNKEFSDIDFLKSLEKTINKNLYPSLWRRVQSLFSKRRAKTKA